ncbi:unnamed protein product, partial [Rotaria sp. Silwood1]
MRMGERVSVTVQSAVTELFEKTLYQSLNEFAAIYWALIKSRGIADGKWKKRTVDVYDGWYDGQYESAQALINRDIVMTAPEYLLSFDLLAIDKCRRNEFEAARSMLTVQRWSKKFVRDVLDESDEVLHVKYQLIYTVGRQQQIDG